MSTSRNPGIDARAERVIPFHKDVKSVALEDAIAEAKPSPWTRSMFLVSYDEFINHISTHIC
jgi:hypothetical protein